MKIRANNLVKTILAVVAFVAVLGIVVFTIYRLSYKEVPPVSNPATVNKYIILTRSYVRGMCASGEGACDYGSEHLYSDGTFGQKKIKMSDVAKIEEEVHKNKWAQYSAAKNPNCPSFADGSDISYIFPSDPKTYTVCMIDIPANDPLLIALDKLGY
jgi:hypothetical protein